MDWYPKSQEGIEAVRKLAVQAEDRSFLEELSGYENLFRKGKVRQKQIQRMAGSLLSKEHAGLWRLMDEKLRQASLAHEPRDYGVEAEKQIGDVRKKLVSRYEEQGFQGDYPFLFHRNGSGEMDRELIFTEEQPFCVMEAKDFQYRIFSMSMEPGQAASCQWSEEAAFQPEIYPAKGDGEE